MKVKSALDNVLEERNVLTMMKSNFVTNLKYALQDEDTMFLVMDLMIGGDLKFHLINAGRFTEKRARFYAAQVLLGLEHVHKLSIIYRDMKLENVLADGFGHCRLSDLGLAVVTKVKIKGYAGTPGYTAPEMIKNKLYGPAADIFSFGVMLYRMLWFVGCPPPQRAQQPHARSQCLSHSSLSACACVLLQWLQALQRQGGSRFGQGRHRAQAAVPERDLQQRSYPPAHRGQHTTHRQ